METSHVAKSSSMKDQHVLWKTSLSMKNIMKVILKLMEGIQVCFREKMKVILALLSAHKVVEFSCLGKTNGSLTGIKENKHSLEEKTQDNTQKSSFHQLAPTVSFNDKILNLQNKGLQSQKKLSTIFKLSFKRPSCDTEEPIDLSKC